MKIEDFKYRLASIYDIDQLAPMIMECLKGPNDKTNYEVIFGISSGELLEMLKFLLRQNIPDHEFYFGSYLVCEKNGELISICSGWKEGANLMDSEGIRSGLIASYLGTDIWQRSYPMLKRFAGISIPRQKGFLYLENANTKKEFRRLNIAYKTVYELIKMRKAQYPELTTIHSHVYLSNKTMYNMFLRFQYNVDKTVLINDPELERQFPVEGLALVSITIKKYLELFETNMSN